MVSYSSAIDRIFNFLAIIKLSRRACINLSGFSKRFLITTENGKGWLVRGYNLSSEPIQVGLKPLRRFAQAALVDLAEEEISPLLVEDDGSVAISAAGHKIVSVMFSD